MDLSVFAKDTFSAKDWVNGILRLDEAQSNPESYASSIVMKLQLAIFEISASLETTSGSVVQNLPRLLRDIELLQNEVEHFKKKLHEFEKEVNKVDKDSTESLDYLIKLDTLKVKLKATSKALQEADNWTTLMTDIEELFESSDLVAISQRLSSLRQSLDLLSHVSDYGDRLLQLDGLKNRLEALASPYLVSAISSGNSDQTSNMVQVFSNMDRLEQLLHYYTKCRRGTILQQWKDLFDSEDITMIDVVNRFYELLLADFQEQSKWYNMVFHHHSMNSSSVLLSIYSQVLTSLDPNPLPHLESLIKKPAASEGLLVLQQLKTFSDRLAQGLEAHTRDSNVAEDDAVFQFEESLYQLFRIIVSSKYRQLCQQYILEQIPSMPSGKNRDGITERIQVLKQNHSKINSIMQSSLNICWNLTQGCGMELLSEAWIQFLTQYVQHYKNVLLDLQGIADSEEDSLHVALSLLQTVGELLLLLEEHDSMFAVQFQNASRKMKEVTPTNYKILYLEPRILQRLENVFVELEKNPSYSCLKLILKDAEKLNSDVQSCIFNTLMSPINEQMMFLGSNDWLSIISSSGLTEDLPEFGLAPMEYITQVGQYLMMLPQHLEPFVLQENKGLSRALTGHTFPQGNTSSAQIEQPHSAADFLIGRVAKANAALLSETIFQIPTINARTAKQLASDIDYLGNIFEDLGLILPPNLSEMSELLRAAATSILTSDLNSFRTVSRDKDHRIVSAIRSMCNLPSVD